MEHRQPVSAWPWIPPAKLTCCRLPLHRTEYGENWGGLEVISNLRNLVDASPTLPAIRARGTRLSIWELVLVCWNIPLIMRSPDPHTAFYLTIFSFSNFGYGGEPNDRQPVHVRKRKGIQLSIASFRRDQNIFDYDLLANPLNPPTSVPNIPIPNSPHEFLLTRRMSDVNLGLFPSAISASKLGWSRVVNEGTSYSSLHNGTDFQLFQPTLNTTDSFSFGISFRVIPKTAINFDQFFTHFKNDTKAGFNNLPFTPFTIANGGQWTLACR